MPDYAAGFRYNMLTPFAMNKNHYVVGLGEILWDKFGETKRLGGAPANFAYHASRFGHEGLVVSAIGNDGDGDDIVAELERKRLAHHLERVDSPTGTVDVDLTDANNPVYTINTDVAWSRIPFTDELADIAAATKAVCFGSLAQWGPVTRKTIGRFLDATPEGCLKVFDVNLRQSYYSKEILEDSFHRCDILKLNIEELQTIARLFGIEAWDRQRTCRDVMALANCRILIVTMGAEGSEIFWEGGRSFLDTPAVKVRSTVGAGDAFTGAFVGSLLSGASIREAHAVAVHVAAYVCTREGAMPPVPEGMLA